MKGRKNCLCTAMLFDPVEKQKEAEAKAAEARQKEMAHKSTLLDRIEESIKRSVKVLATIVNLVP